jgi:2-oxoglutarate ferredoxin oxidoreductase subunit gamma
MRREIRISGFGGQGVVLTGYLLGKAYSIYQNLDSVMTQAYGPEARGGSSSACVVVADRPIDYPFVDQVDCLIALSQEAYTRFRPEVKSNGLVLIDEGLVECRPGDEVLGIPATRFAEELGRRIVANVVMLGFFTKVTDFVERDAVLEAIRSTVKAKTLGLNLQAFNCGYDFTPQRERVS